jgi:hypothetical protein
MKTRGRPKRAFTRREVVKINFLYYTNDRNITDVSKIVAASSQTVCKYLFKSKSEYEQVTDTWRIDNLSDEDVIVTL